MSPLVGVLLGRGMATLRELETYYSYEDALNMLEIIRVNTHNETQVWKHHGNSH